MAASLEKFGITLEPRQLGQLAAYLRLLLRWNRSINLTAVRDPQEVVTRHFAESMYLARFEALRGSLLDVGSGAGFPGLPLKIAVPELAVVLLEPIAKKRAFLKEVARECELRDVEVSGSRLQELADGGQRAFDFITVRAVGDFSGILPAASRCLATSGQISLWVTNSEAATLSRQEAAFEGLFSWSTPIPIPLSRDREIWRGKLQQPL